MLRGDLSAEAAPALGMRVEGVLKILGRLNRPAKGFLDQMTSKGDLNIYLITMEDRRKTLAFCVKWAVPYTQVVQVDSTLEIPDVVRENHMIAYFDVDEQVVENVIARRGSTYVNAEVWKAFKWT